jgi:hypothetical protein
VLGVHLENTVLRLAIAAVRFEDDVHWRVGIPVLVYQLGADLEDEGGARDVERVGRTAECSRGRAWRAEHPMEQACRAHPPLKHRSADSVLHVGRAELVEHRDDAVASEVRRVAERRPPILVSDSGVLPEEIRMLQHERAHGADVVVPDRVYQVATDDEARPTRGAVAARERELRVGELGVRGVGRLWMEFLEILERFRFTAVNRAKQIFRLVPQVIEVGADGQVTSGHDEPP